MKTFFCFKTLQIISGFFLLWVIWESAAVFMRSSLILPSSFVVFEELRSLLTNPQAWLFLLQTVLKAFFALALSLILGIPLGFLIGMNRFLERVFSPGLFFLKSTPIVSWLTSALILWGIGWQAPVFIVFVTLLPVIVLTIATGVRTVDAQLLEMAVLFNVSTKRKIADIYFASLLPFLFSTIQICIGMMWKSAIAAEFLIGDSGIGVQIAWAKYYVDTPKVVAYTLFAIVFGFLIEYCLKGILNLPSLKKWKSLWNY